MSSLLKSVIVAIAFVCLINISPSDQRQYHHQLDQYVAKFTKLTHKFGLYKGSIKSRLDSIKINTSDLKDSQAGLCHIILNRIILDKETWKVSSTYTREELLFHELKHCVFQETKHTEKGIMKASGFHSEVYYKSNYQKLINELFGCQTGDCVKIEWDDNYYKE